jgi:hypothetical protein
VLKILVGGLLLLSLVKPAPRTIFDVLPAFRGAMSNANTLGQIAALNAFVVSWFSVEPKIGPFWNLVCLSVCNAMVERVAERDDNADYRIWLILIFTVEDERKVICVFISFWSCFPVAKAQIS